ncbi:MAG: DNA-deoxyinosine glycosylase, partial [Oscillospiraceae bacterium]|nr:DNA-deoxyinosine glycosylase [Oscillospiraceae bacterium]
MLIANEYERVFHELEPVFDERSQVLILGTMPSPKSREAGFYYMHPQNRFWKMLSAVLGEPLPPTAAERRDMCLLHNIALWDVLAGCDIDGAADSSIRNAVPNDIGGLLSKSRITAVFTTGRKAHELYRRFFPELIGDVCLPSTSPANRTITEDKMLEEY